MIKIAAAYGDLLNMYGDYANVAALARYLREAGFLVETGAFSIGGYIELSAYDMLYIGAGTERRMLAALDDFKRFYAELRAFAAGGGFVLATGNAAALLGNTTTDIAGTAREGAGLIDMDAAIVETRSYSEMILTTRLSKNQVFGCINSSLKISWRGQPFFNVINSVSGVAPKTEGVLNGGVYATQLSGPLLVRNPGLLHGFAELVSDKKINESDEQWVKHAAEAQRRVLLKLQRKKKG